jgi:hypothetical protein
MQEMIKGGCTSPKRLGNLGVVRDADRSRLQAVFFCLNHGPGLFSLCVTCMGAEPHDHVRVQYTCFAVLPDHLGIVSGKRRALYGRKMGAIRRLRVSVCDDKQ